MVVCRAVNARQLCALGGEGRGYGNQLVTIWLLGADDADNNDYSAYGI